MYICCANKITQIIYHTMPAIIIIYIMWYSGNLYIIYLSWQPRTPSLVSTASSMGLWSATAVKPSCFSHSSASWLLMRSQSSRALNPRGRQANSFAVAVRTWSASTHGILLWTPLVLCMGHAQIFLSSGCTPMHLCRRSWSTWRNTMGNCQVFNLHSWRPSWGTTGSQKASSGTHLTVCRFLRPSCSIGSTSFWCMGLPIVSSLYCGMLSKGLGFQPGWKNFWNHLSGPSSFRARGQTRSLGNGTHQWSHWSARPVSCSVHMGSSESSSCSLSGKIIRLCAHHARPLSDFVKFSII